MEIYKGHAIFMLGLPGSGKSTIAERLRIEEGLLFLKEKDVKMVSADEIRLKHEKYDPEHPEDIHEECVKLAEEKMYEYAKKEIPLIIMDGGGINNSYTVRILLKIKESGYKTKVVFVDTPVDICIKRNNERINNNQRFVPTENIIMKAYKLKTSVEKLKEVADEFVTIEYFTNSYIFCDLDGTIAEYQQLPTDENGDINFVAYEVFRNAKPVMEIIEKLEALYNTGKRIFIVSASPNSICNKEKIEWINKYLWFIKNEDIYFVGNKNYKYVFLKQLIQHLKLSTKDCTVLDDDHNILLSYKPIGVNAIHPSKFLSNF